MSGLVQALERIIADLSSTILLRRARNGFVLLSEPGPAQLCNALPPVSG